MVGRRRLVVPGAALALLTAAAFFATAAARSAVPAPHLLPRSAGQVTSFAFDPVDPEIVYAGTSLRTNGLGGVYKSVDGGGHWQLSAGFAVPVTALAADPERPGTLYAATGVAVWTWPNNVPTFKGWEHVAVYRTVNGGRTWQRRSRGLLSAFSRTGQTPLGTPPGWVNALAVDLHDSNVVYAGTGGGILKSSDGGHSWSRVLSGSKFLGVSGLEITPAPPQAVYAAALIRKPGRCRMPTMGAPMIGRCDQSTLFYKSVDNGMTWRATNLRQVGLDGPLVLDAQSPTTMYAAGGFGVYFGVYREGPNSEKGIFKTTDGGHNWTRLNPACPITALAVDPARTSTIYAGIYRGRGPYYRIIKSIDNGQTWTVTG